MCAFQGFVIYCRGRWSDSKNTVNTFLLRNPAVQESPAQTSLFGRSLAAKVHWTFGPALPCKLHAGLLAGEAFESDHLPFSSILYIFRCRGPGVLLRLF